MLYLSFTLSFIFTVSHSLFFSPPLSLLFPSLPIPMPFVCLCLPTYLCKMKCQKLYDIDKKKKISRE